MTEPKETIKSLSARLLFNSQVAIFNDLPTKDYMKKIYCFSIMALSLLALSAQEKLNLSAKMLMHDYEQILNGADPKLFDPRLSVKSRAAGSVPEIGVIVTLNPGYSVEDISTDSQVCVTVDLGDMAVVSVPVTKLEEFAANPAVKSVSASELRDAKLYAARSSADVDEVHSGEELESAYTGAGVVVGLMDTGLDPNHINFSKTGDVNESRVKAVYAYTGSNGNVTRSATTPEEIKDFTTDTNGETHGTHVIGIAAGGYKGEATYALNSKRYDESPMPYYGVATGADIVMTGGQLYDSNIVAGVQKVIEYAEEQGQPAVVNLSLGSILGPHDGSSATSQALSRLGERAIICVAAGNDAGEDCAFKMSGGRSAAQRTNAVGFGYADSGYEGQVCQAEFWGNDAEEFTFEFVLYSSDTNSVVYTLNVPNNNGSGIGIGGSSMSSAYQKDDNFDAAFTSNSYIAFFSQVDASNNRYNVLMQFKLSRGSDSDLSISPGVRITRKSGQVVTGCISQYESAKGKFLTESGTWDGLYWANTAVSDNGSISDMATGSNIISVGAYTSSTHFSAIVGNNVGNASYDETTGEICSFSSYGVNPVTEEEYPYVCGPGSAIVSSISNYVQTSYYSASAGGNGRNNLWFGLQGTSMACPFVTGVVALWLEADPTLTVADVKEVISATSTPYTGSDSDLKVKWGAGKINAHKGIKEVVARLASIGDVWADDAESRLVVTAMGDGYDVYVAGAEDMIVTLYDMQGRAIKTIAGVDGNAVVGTSDVQKGIYALEARGADFRFTRKIAVR